MADPASTSVLVYNLRWVQRTFTSPHTTAELLAPYREHLPPHDYDAALAFLPGLHRHYSLLAAFAAVPLFYAVRRPSSSRHYAALAFTSFAGFFTGHAISVASHFKFVHSIHDPAAFGQALNDIQRRSGLPVPPGPVIVRKGAKTAIASDPSESPSEQSSFPAPNSPAALPLSTKPFSRWDQIRSANTPGASVSSWDTLREKHERQRIPSTTQPNCLDPSEQKDRVAEQAEFDALLERERNIK